MVEKNTYNMCKLAIFGFSSDEESGLILENPRKKSRERGRDIYNTDTLLQAAHRTTDYMYIDTGVENSSLYRAATAGLVAKL